MGQQRADLSVLAKATRSSIMSFPMSYQFLTPQPCINLLSPRGFDTIPDLLTLDVPAFLSATARPAYTLGETNRLSVLLAFNNANVTHNGGYTVDYERVTRDMFTCYYQGTYYTPPGTPTIPPPMNCGYQLHAPSGGLGPTGHHRHPQTPTEERLNNFIWGAKRNKSDYPSLSKDSEYLRK
jgi:hypothetical protein